MSGQEPQKESTEPKEVVPVPPVEVRARPITEDDSPPQAARQMQNLALKHGWEVEVKYARGPYTNANGSFNRVVDSYSVIMTRDGVRLVGVWVDGTASQAGKMPFHTGAASDRGGLMTSEMLKARVRLDNP